MAELTQIGFSTLAVVPSFRGFGAALNRGVGPELDRSGRQSGRRMGGAMSAGIGGATAKMFAPVAAGIAALGIGSFFSGAISSASDLSESGSKVGVVFGKSSAQIVAASKTSATAMGLTEGAYLSANGTLGNLMVSLGIAPAKAAGMSQQMVTLASDMASFNNVPIEDALAAIQSGLTGETEPLKAFGVNMNDATLKAQALKMGLIKSTKEAMSPQTKALAAQALIMAQTGTAQGDFARTSGGLANQQKILGAQFENIKTKVGGALLPAFTGLVSFMNKSIGPAFSEAGGGVKAMAAAFKAGGSDVTSSGFAGVMERIGLAGRRVADFFTGTVVPGIRALVAAFQAGGSDVTSSGFAGVMERIGLGARVVANFFMQRVVPAVMGVVDAFRTYAAVIIPIVQAFVTGMMARIAPMLPTIRNIFKQIGDVITGALGLIKAVIQRVTSVISFIWSRWGGSIMSFISGVWSKILTIINAALGVIRGVIKTVTSVIKGDWSGAWTGIRLILSSAWTLIKGIISGALRIIGGIISGAWGLITAGVSAAWGKIKERIATAWGGIKTAVSTKTGELVTFVKGIPAKILASLGALTTLLKQKGKDVIQGFFDGLKEIWTKITTWVGTIAGWIKDHKGPLSLDKKLLTPAGEGIMDGFHKGLMTGFDRVKSGVLSMTGSIAGSASLGMGYLRQMAILREQFPGLPMFSGPRPNAITSSGNQSFHALGRAVDVPPSMAIFNWLKANYPNSREIIYTPAGSRQVKNGQEMTYGGQVAADHWDHVHWAYAGGTNNAAPGYAWVGERGPEIVKFRGGETVIPNHKLGGGATSADIRSLGDRIGKELERQARTIQTMQRQMAGAR